MAENKKSYERHLWAEFTDEKAFDAFLKVVTFAMPAAVNVIAVARDREELIQNVYSDMKGYEGAELSPHTCPCCGKEVEE